MINSQGNVAFSIKTTNEELPLHLVKYPINLIASVYHYFPKFMNNWIYLRGSMDIGVFYKEQGKKYKKYFILSKI
jgi:hypothetical protein